MSVQTTHSVPSATSVTALSDTIVTQYRVEQFLYREAELLDRWLWPEWLELFAEDIRYWMPVRKNRLRRQRNDDEAASRGIEMAHFDDDINSLRLRVQQMGSGKHWSEDPPSRCRHMVSNVRVNRSVEGAELEATSNFVVYRNRLEVEVDLWVGERRDLLRPVGESFEIARRTILLDQNVVMSKNLSVLF